MKLIFEQSHPGHRSHFLPASDVPAAALPEDLARASALDLPELTESELARHYEALAQQVHGVNKGFYPLGSCTMKYNPRIDEDAAALPGFTGVHPLQSETTSRGCREVLRQAEERLTAVTGMDRMTFQPAAGAHGEYMGLLLIKAYHERRGDKNRTKVLVPDSAHGTNPASAAMCGYQVVSIPSDANGLVDLEKLREAAGPDTAALMLTNPNTVGLFDPNILEITRIVHQAGGLCYYDGANLNAIMGWARPGDMGFDVVHLNLHKTFATPHGGGGPGSGPVGAKAHLAPFLPVPVLQKDGGAYRWDFDRPLSIGQMHAFYGNVGVVVKAYAYMLALGAEGIRDACRLAVLAANYLRVRLGEDYDIAYDALCKHEFVLSAARQMHENHVGATDICKRLIDMGYHPPTVHFPLIVKEALMIEPNETESLERLDGFVEAMRAIARECRENPEIVRTAPHTCPITRVDEVKAARNPVVKYEEA